MVSAAGLSPAQIVFEVTESERVPSNPGHLIGILDYFRVARFRVALDDVGSGYSSLVMLGNVRPDFLKLDNGLTTGVIDDPFRAVIAEKLIETALGTGMAIVAEGIERPRPRSGTRAAVCSTCRVTTLLARPRFLRAC